MEWKNLTKNKCPKCGKMLTWKDDGYMRCPDEVGCKFLIQEEKMGDIVVDMQVQSLKGSSGEAEDEV